jgi:hypothetical protein
MYQTLKVICQEVGAECFGYQSSDQKVEVRGAAGLSGVGHVAAHLATVEVANGSVVSGEDGEAGDVGVQARKSPSLARGAFL